MTPPDGYRHATPLQVRFADLDVLGHLNNAKYLTYIEQARIRYVQDVCGWQGSWNMLGMILAKTTIEYKLPILYNDDVVTFTRCSRLGGKSFDLEYVLMRQQGDNKPELTAHCITVMVAYDYPSDRTIAVPDDWRSAIMAYEPTLTNQ